MKKKYNQSEEECNEKKISESDLPYYNRLEQSIQQAKEGKTVKVTTDEELKKLLDNL